ncbi:MAG TPA: biotin/lipoyl-containing protein [Anaerolineales bacterium]
MTRLAFDNIVLDVSPDGGAYSISIQGRSHHIEVLEASGGRFDLLVDDRHVAAYVSADRLNRWVTLDGRTVRLTKAATSRPAVSHDGSSELSAPMPGQVKAVNVNPGERVAKGQVLLVLEAMKMEIRLQSPFDGLVASVDARVGQTVEREQILVKLQQVPAASS